MSQGYSGEFDQSSAVSPGYTLALQGGGGYSMGGGNSNNLYPQNIQNMSLNPPDYDPRRLFPFGLSPIPEVPSELASEVSSIASSPTPSYDDSDTEIESVRSRGSIMYSGSCDSIKSNATIHGKTSDESSTESEDEVTATEEDETEDEQEFSVEKLPVDTVSPVIKISEHEVKISHPTQEKSVETSKDTLYQSEVTQVTQISHSSGSVREEQAVVDGERAGAERPEIILDMGSGAATASEIFRHLQATRGKQEVTTELAKILTVLKTTLQNDKDSSSSDEETTSNLTSQTKNPMPTGKPPRPPFKPKAKSLASISPLIQAKIKELEQSKSNNPKEEMNLLSKILVHLLCSCKTAAAAQELKAVIKQFKEVAKVAMEEGDDSLEALKICSRPNSRTSVRRKARSRTASGNSNISGNSETDSLNTLTPGDSKSSGTDDETAGDSNLNKLRFTSNVVKKEDVESCVSYTLTLPLAKQHDLGGEDGDNYDEGDEEWEWEYEDELDASTPTKQGSSGSSRNLTPSEGKSDVSSGSTRKLLTEMELGAYNSSTSQSDHGNSQSTPITEEEEEDYSDDDCTRRRQTSGPKEVSGLFCHLEETFKVLSDTYKIITTGDNSPECENYPHHEDQAGQAIVRHHGRHGDSDDGFEGILDGISNQCVQIETEILRNSRQSTPASPGPGKVSRPSSRVSSRSRPGSRQNTKTPSSGQDEEDWGDEDGWEYYYEEDYPEDGQEGEVKVSRPPSRQRPLSRPVSRQKEMEHVKVLSRPASAARVASRPASRAKESQESKNDDWNYEEWGDPSEWEYYYEDEADETGMVTSRPVSRAASRVASRAPSRQGTEPVMRAASRQESLVQPPSRTASRQDSLLQPSSRTASRQESLLQPPSRTVSRQEALVQPPSRTASRQESLVQPPSRTASRQESLVQPPSRTASRQESLIQPPSRTASRQDTLRPTSRQEVMRPSSRQEPIRVASRQEVPRAAEIVAEMKELGERVPSRIRVVSRPASRAKEEEDWEWDTGDGEWEGYEGEWEYYYEETEPAPPPPANNTAKVAPAIVINKDSRPSSRQTQSRPNSRPTSRTGSRAASRLLRNQSALGSVYEEDDQWYEDDDELARLSPTLTTAPTTRATSPFPNEREAPEYNAGSGFSGRRCSVIVESEESTPRPSTVISKTPTNMDSVTPKPSRPVSKQSNPDSVGYLKRTAVASVALAAEYLGQDAVMLAASLPPEFIEENIVKDKKKKKQRRKESDSQEDYDGEVDKKKRKKKKKDKDGKFLPKVGVKELANRLEGELFQDNVVGAKMVISKDEARDVIRESRKKMKSVNSCLQESSKASTPARHSPPDKEDKRKSVKEMVEILSTQQLQEQAARAAGGPPPPVPPPPQNYYSSPSPQYPPNYQPYPVEVRAQYPHYQQDNPYQQYPPQHPYQQYQQQYHAYQGYPPPPPPHYQQYPPQQYQQYQQYPPPQGYAPQYQYQPQPPPPPPQPMIYQGDSANQMKVVSGGQTTMVNMRNKNSGARQKEMREQQRSPDDSEAYGTGSTGSDGTENQVAGIDHDEGVEQEGGAKPHKRHSRLFKLLQDSDYTDSDTDSRADFSSRISMKNVEDNHGKESDRDSICSGLERKTMGLDRKHSFRSHKSSNKESDNESVTSSGVERKLSPNSMQKTVTTRRLMQLSLNTEYEPSSSELSTPNSPTTVGPADRKRSNSKPPSRVWNYHADDFDSHAGTSDDSSYQSLQSLNSFDSIYESNAGREVEEIMKRKVGGREGLYRYSTDSPHNYVTASPKTVEILRNSPKIHSTSPKIDAYQRASPKIEQELMELTNFPSSPGITLRQLQTHRNLYGPGGLGK